MVKTFPPRDCCCLRGPACEIWICAALAKARGARHTFGVLQRVATFAQRGVPAIELFHRAT